MNINLEVVKDSKAITFRELYEKTQEEIKNYEEYLEGELLDELMEAPMIIHISDGNGNTLQGKINGLVDMMEDGSYLMTGKLTEIYE